MTTIVHSFFHFVHPTKHKLMFIKKSTIISDLIFKQETYLFSLYCRTHALCQLSNTLNGLTKLLQQKYSICKIASSVNASKVNVNSYVNTSGPGLTVFQVNYSKICPSILSQVFMPYLCSPSLMAYSTRIGA